MLILYIHKIKKVNHSAKIKRFSEREVREANGLTQ
jgi:hypothetical protein